MKNEKCKMQRGSANLEAVEVGHPVYPVTASRERVEALKEAVAPLTGMSEAEMVGLAPDKTGFRFVGCANCDEGTQEGQLTWSIDDPHRVRCTYCGMVFPNEQYREDRVMRMTNPVGEEVEYPYWEDEMGYRYLFSAKAWREARVYFAARGEDLGALYQATGDRAYARRAALILDAFARYYPGFLVSSDRANQQKGFVLEPPYPNTGGKWGRWRADEMPTDLVYAYDSIYNSGELKRLSGEVGVDVKARIENNFFRGAVRQDEYHGPQYGNASPRIYEGYAVIGRVLGDPGLVHEAVRRSVGLFERRFFADGFWCEGSVGYHRMTMRGMTEVLDALRGYSDPPGYTDPEDGTRFEDLDLERDTPIIGRANRILEICHYPDGRPVPFHDNWAYLQEPRVRRNLKVPERSVSTLLSGMGHAWLGRGGGEAQAQVHLHFSGGYGHEHADNLSIALFARGQELLPDLGYTHTRYRAWSKSTLGHNTVLIDEHRQYTQGDGGPSDGRLLGFETAFEPVQWMEASAEQAYPGLAKVYRRTVMFVDAGGTDTYAVDLFRVVGGSQHDWALHGNADWDGDATISVPLQPYAENLLPGVKVRFPAYERDQGEAEGRNPSYAFFQNVSRGEVTDGATVTFTVSESPVGVRSHLPGLSGAEVFLGDAPSLRRAEENDALLNRYRMPIFLARREGPPPLSSCFAAVHEPYGGEPFVDSVTLETPEGDAIALRVRHHGVTDHIVHRAEPGRGPLRVGNLRIEGEVGFVREREGIPEMMGVWGGVEIRWGAYVLSGSGVYEGKVMAVLREAEGAPYNALVVQAYLPEGEGMKGATAIATFGDGSTFGCRVAEVKRVGEERHLVLEEDPGISVEGDGARRLSFPQRKMPGQVSFRVRTSAFVRLGDGEPEVASVGEAQFSGSG